MRVKGIRNPSRITHLAIGLQFASWFVSKQNCDFLDFSLNFFHFKYGVLFSLSYCKFEKVSLNNQFSSVKNKQRSVTNYINQRFVTTS